MSRSKSHGWLPQHAVLWGKTWLLGCLRRSQLVIRIELEMGIQLPEHGLEACQLIWHSSFQPWIRPSRLGLVQHQRWLRQLAQTSMFASLGLLRSLKLKLRQCPDPLHIPVIFFLPFQQCSRLSLTPSGKQIDKRLSVGHTWPTIPTPRFCLSPGWATPR